MQSQATDIPVRIGLVFPGGGCEADFDRFEMDSNERARVYFAQSSYGVVDGADHHPDALRETARVEQILDAAVRLSGVPLDVLAWACTSGSFINGRAFAEKQARGLSDALGIPATSTSLAFAAAAEKLKVRRVSLLATYPEETAGFFVDFLREYDVEVTSVRSLNFESGWLSSGLSNERLVEEAAKADIAGADALLIPDTALPTLGAVQQMENRLGLPVLSANAVTLWHAGQVAGAPITVAGLGGLLAGTA